MVVVGFTPLVQDLYKCKTCTGARPVQVQDLYKFFKVNNVLLVGYGKSKNNCKYHECLFVILMYTIRITK